MAHPHNGVLSAVNKTEDKFHVSVKEKQTGKEFILCHLLGKKEENPSYVRKKWYYLCEVPKLVKFIKTCSSLLAACE